MSKIEQYNLNLDNLRFFFTVSNIPSYLLKRFSEDESVKSLAENYSSEDLQKLYVDSARSYETNASEPYDVIIGYAALVALTLQETDEATIALDALTPFELDWGRDIRKIYFKKKYKALHE